MDQICGHRDTSSPACLIDSGLPDEQVKYVYLTGKDLYDICQQHDNDLLYAKPFE